MPILPWCVDRIAQPFPLRNTHLSHAYHFFSDSARGDGRVRRPPPAERADVTFRVIASTIGYRSSATAERISRLASDFGNARMLASS